MIALVLRETWIDGSFCNTRPLEFESRSVRPELKCLRSDFIRFVILF